MIQIIQMDKRIRFEQKSVTVDSIYGTETAAWVHIATVWAEVMHVLPTRTQAEQMRNGIQVAVRRARVRMRYRTDLDASMRCMIGSDVWQIVGGPADIGRNEYMELLIERAST